MSFKGRLKRRDGLRMANIKGQRMPVILISNLNTDGLRSLQLLVFLFVADGARRSIDIKNKNKNSLKLLFKSIFLKVPKL